MKLTFILCCGKLPAKIFASADNCGCASTDFYLTAVYQLAISVCKYLLSLEAQAVYLTSLTPLPFTFLYLIARTFSQNRRFLLGRNIFKG